ncbi:MAG: hypothetical protein L6264_04305 [Weeksellaceae bacterium]|nr:hypothetical protein [Bacteroidota bacterium]MCG2780148.1 hypothetical protein [Weeksellaceae bacterium]
MLNFEETFFFAIGSAVLRIGVAVCSGATAFAASGFCSVFGTSGVVDGLPLRSGANIRYFFF